MEQARFAPLGNRGFSPLTKYDALGEPLRVLGDATYVVAQIEGRQALANIAAIAAVPGVDAVFVGPYDLALSTGRASRQSSRCLPPPKSFPRTVPDGVALGIYIDDPAQCGDWAARRFRAAMRQLRRPHAGERRPLGRDAGEAGDSAKRTTR